jgi:hypothetical protein
MKLNLLLNVFLWYNGCAKFWPYTSVSLYTLRPYKSLLYTVGPYRSLLLCTLWTYTSLSLYTLGGRLRTVKISTLDFATYMLMQTWIHMFYHGYVGGQDTVVDIATVTGWTVRGSGPGGGEIFRAHPYRPRGPPSLLYSRYRPSLPG